MLNRTSRGVRDRDLDGTSREWRGNYLYAHDKDSMYVLSKLFWVPIRVRISSRTERVVGACSGMDRTAGVDSGVDKYFGWSSVTGMCEILGSVRSASGSIVGLCSISGSKSKCINSWG